jgi:glycosyltransferase involved in cell wall biosynthesis
MPTVVVEAMAAGARVVGSAVDGIPDVIRHGENGWLCRPADPGDLADKILCALADGSPSAILEQSARTADALDWSAVAARYAAVFRELAAAPAEPAR